MEPLILAASVVFPLCVMMALGYFLRWKGLFYPSFLEQLNKVCFQVFLPTLLFNNIYHSDFKALFNPPLILYAVGSLTASFFALLFLIPLLEKKDENRGVVIQGIFRSNYALFGMPVAVSLYGLENSGITAVLITFVVPLYNIYAIIALSLYSDKKEKISKVIQKILKNPLIIGSVLGMILSSLEISLPAMAESAISDIAGVATPLSLIALGGGFAFSDIFLYKKALILTLMGKLLVLPGIFIVLAIHLGFRDMELVALVAMWASPTAVSSYTMAQSMKANDVLAGQIVVFGTLLSVFTMFLWILLLSTLSYL